MPDYGHDIQFGYFLNPDASDPSGTLETARYVDELGYDLIGIQDHPYVESHLDAWALMAVILGQTEHVRLFPDVTNLQLRSAALVAKTAATLDQLSSGRFELGIGTGAPLFHDQAVAMGAPERTPGEQVDAVEEGIEVIRAMWSGQENVRAGGDHFRLDRATGGPPPAHEMEIWVGASGPRMLRLIGQKADGWVIPLMQYMPPAKAAENSLLIDEGATDAGRDPAEIRRIYNCIGQFANDVRSGSSGEDTKITGPVDHWVEILTHQAVDFGFSTFLLIGPPNKERLSTFINEVAPKVRERVAAHRQ